MPLPPASALELSPAGNSTNIVGQVQKLSVLAMGVDGHPIGNVRIHIKAFGANPLATTSPTDPAGRTDTSFTGRNAGVDTVVATAFIGGFLEVSNSLVLSWTAPPPAVAAGPAPPTITDVAPVTGTVVTAPLSVTATISPVGGDAVASYAVRVQLQSGGPSTVIASGNSPVPPVLGMLDPASLTAGRYVLTVSAVSGAGGTASLSTIISVAPSPASIPPVTSGATPPSISNLQPIADAIITMPTSVTESVSPSPLDAIASYSLIAQPVGGGNPTSIAAGLGAPPPSLGSIDPTQWASGVYDLVITVTAVSGSSTQLTEPVVIVSSALSQVSGSPSIVAQPGQSTFGLGQPLSINVVASNTNSAPCQLSSLPYAIAITDVQVNGVSLAATGSAFDPIGVPDTSGDFSDVAPGGSVTVALTSSIDPTNGSVTLSTVDYADSILLEWPIDQIGQYQVSLGYSTLLIPGAINPCPGSSQVATVTFQVVGAAATSTLAVQPKLAAALAGCGGTDPALSNVPSYVCVPETDPAFRFDVNSCFMLLQRWDGPSGNVLKNLEEQVTGTGQYLGYTIDVVLLNGKFDPAKVAQKIPIAQGVDTAWINDFSARVTWDPNRPFSVVDDEVSVDVCGDLYHELTHVRSALLFAAGFNSKPLRTSPADANFTLVYWSTQGDGGQLIHCTISGLPPLENTSINITEARAVQAENAFRNTQFEDPRTFYDYPNTAEREPDEAATSNVPVCDDPPQLLIFSYTKPPYVFPK